MLSSVAQLLLPQLPSATFGAAGSGVAASCSVVCSSVALATGLIIAMGIATYTLRLAARNTSSGSPRFLALPVLTLPFNRAKSCLLPDGRPPSFDDEARAVRAIAWVSLSVAHSLGHEREGYRANAEPQSKLFY